MPFNYAYFVTGRHILGWSTYLSSACQHGPSRCCLEMCISSHIVYSRLLERLASSHWVVFFNRCIPTPWPLGVKMRNPLRSWGLSFQFWVFDVSRGGSKVARTFSFTIHSGRAAEVFSFTWSTDHIGGFRYCCWVALFLRSRLPGFFGILILQKSPLFSRGS